jgi:hypothetical protein
VKPQAKVGRVMREFKKGELKSSSGQKVTNPKQAIAIGLSEAGISKKARGGEMKESKAMMKKEVSFMKKKGAPKSMLKHEMAEMKGMKKGGNVKKMAMGGASGKPLPSEIVNKHVSMVPRPKIKPTPEMVNKHVSMVPTTPRPPIRRGFGPNDAGPRPTPKPRDIGTGMGPRPTITPRPRDIGTGNVPPPGIGPIKQALNKPAMKKGGSVKKMASGGLAAGHKAADGVARKGKTKAMQVKMAGGGKTKKYC